MSLLLSLLSAFCVKRQALQNAFSLLHSSFPFSVSVRFIFFHTANHFLILLQPYFQLHFLVHHLCTVNILTNVILLLFIVSLQYLIIMYLLCPTDYFPILLHIYISKESNVLSSLFWRIHVSVPSNDFLTHCSSVHRKYPTCQWTPILALSPPPCLEINDHFLDSEW